VSPLAGALYKHGHDNYNAAKDVETLRVLIFRGEGRWPSFGIVEIQETPALSYSIVIIVHYDQGLEKAA